MYRDDSYYYDRHGRDDRRLRTDRYNGWLGGVCAGIGRHLDVNPMLVRIGVVTAGLFLPGITLGGYVVAWLLMRRG